MKGFLRMPRIDFRTTCPWCHGEAENYAPMYRYYYCWCCSSYWKPSEGSKSDIFVFGDKIEFIIVRALYVTSERVTNATD